MNFFEFKRNRVHWTSWVFNIFHQILCHYFFKYFFFPFITLFSSYKCLYWHTWFCPTWPHVFKMVGDVSVKRSASVEATGRSSRSTMNIVEDDGRTSVSKTDHFAVIGPSQKGPLLGLIFCVTVIKSSVIFEQWQHFHSASGPAYYVTSLMVEDRFNGTDMNQNSKDPYTES